MLTYNKALALTSALAIVLVAGAFWLMWYFLPLLLQAPFLSTLVILLVTSLVLALLIRIGSKHKQREEQRLRDNASRKREEEAQQRAAREREVAQRLDELEAELREKRREAEHATAWAIQEAEARRATQARLEEQSYAASRWEEEGRRAQENEATVRRFLQEVWSEGHTSVVHDVLAPHFVAHGPGGDGELRGPERVADQIEYFRNAFPDLTYTIEDQVAAGDEVVSRYTVSGTHLGEFLGVSGTDNRIEITGITMYRIEDGRIVEAWDSPDNLSLMQQLGILPEERA
jgi:steroid delta-isomerase-like uncharacterized protein